jgi:hypothetical protein
MGATHIIKVRIRPLAHHVGSRKWALVSDAEIERNESVQ